ncbi:hypothetical protein DYU11_28475 [Fibrisoma montanum]|uniref:Lipoprotein n=1 Tax=Fibrisoma montanum TaxID=2305895 RepID=A0A418LZ00_9BACT|nr:hypothetical protein [Fibrisoma montanum]RIV18510.1 hypothetical protein DYU11_28475 [Fibrisoma montanum]
MKSTILFASVLVSSLFIASCSQESTELGPNQPGVLYETNFQQSKDGWEADVVDYGPQIADIQFKSDWVSLPSPLNTNQKSIMVSSMNRSDDLFMYIRKKLTGLTPNTTYSLVFDVELASQYADNSVGIGGSPGSSVYLKAGASATEPKKELKNNFYEISIDKGNQAEGGRDALLLGTIGAGNDVTDYKLITRSNAEKPLQVKTNANGELWLVVGTDSGFEGLTTLYYSKIKVTAK